MLNAMFMLVLLSNIVMIITARARVSAVGKGEVPLDYFRLMQGAQVPDFIAKSTRNFNNLFEVPTLFYAGGAVYLALGLQETVAVGRAWAFVASRVVHTCVHLGYNNVMHRLIVFGLGNLAALAMWVAIMMEAS